MSTTGVGEEPTASRPGLRQRVATNAGQDPARCYQCGRCSAGYPVAGDGDLQPHQVLRLVQLGDELVVESLQPWLCVSCQTCATRWPQQVDLSAIMDGLRTEASERGVAPAAARDLVAFNQVFVERIAASGRLNEAELGAHFNLRTRSPFKNLSALPGMLARGKLRLPGGKIAGAVAALQAQPTTTTP